MKVARVVGNVWATRKHPGLDGAKLLLVRPLDTGTGKPLGEISLAVDRSFGAGPGDTVLIMDEGSSARQVLKDPSAPVRLVICGIVDSVYAEGKEAKYH